MKDIGDFKEKIIEKITDTFKDDYFSMKTKDKEKKYKSIWVYLWLDLWKAFAKIVMDKDYTIVVFQSEEHGIYCILFWWSRSFDDMLPDSFEDFHYQNQYDKPKEIGEEEWWMRIWIWNEIMPSGIPNQDGLIYTILDEQQLKFAFWNLKNTKSPSA